MGNKIDKYSIIIPTFNGIDFIKDCIYSVLQQTYRSFNIIILDSGSTDGTIEFLQQLNSPKIIIYPTDKRLYIEDNWGRITSIPTNEFITILGQDDILMPNYLEVIDMLTNKYPQASLYQTHFRFIDAKGKNLRPCFNFKNEYSGEDFLTGILQKQIDISATGYMMRSKDYAAVGGIPTKYPNLLYADYELWIKLCNINYLSVANEICFAFRKHNSTTSVSSDIKMMNAFLYFMNFLKELQNKNSSFKNIIDSHLEFFVQQNAKGLASRLIRKPLPERENFTVKQLFNNIDNYLQENFKANHVDYKSHPVIKATAVIDSNSITQSLFLLFKKIYSKPIF